MKRTLEHLLLIAVALAFCAAAAPAQTNNADSVFDVLILNGHIIDGTGSPWYAADIGIRNGRIAAIGRLDSAQAERRIDAAGLTVSPGFIDMHSHSDAALMRDGGCCSKLYEGVTTEVLGETAAVPVAGPLAGSALERERRLFAQENVRLDWTTIGGFLDRLQRQGLKLNALTYATFGAIRESVLGMENRPPTSEELARERQMMRQAMNDGAFGLATGLLYTPDQFASTEEIVALARIAGEMGGIYASHIRNLTDVHNSGMREAIEIGRRAHVPVQIFHLQVEKQEGPEAARNAIAVIDQAREQGVDISADAYPYEAANNPLSSMVPAEYLVGGDAALAQRLRDPALRPRLVQAIAAAARTLGTPDDPDGWKEEFISHVGNPADARYVGKSFYQIGEIDHTSPAEAIANLLERENGGASRMFYNKTPESIREIMKVLWVSVGGDASDYDIAHRDPLSAPHPRNFGTEAHILGPWVRDGTLTLPDAVRKMTSLAAQSLRLPDRGVLKPGFWADIVIFNPAEVQDHSTYTDPWHYSTGVRDVLVNGVPVLLDGHETTAKPGRALRGPAWRK